MDETPALHHLLTRLEQQISRQCATILYLRRDLDALQQENRRLRERLTARDVLAALDVAVEPAPEPLPAVPTSATTVPATGSAR